MVTLMNEGSKGHNNDKDDVNTTRDESNVRAMYWNPQNPSNLKLIDKTSSDGNDGSSSSLILYQLYADTGNVCTEYELTALLKIINIHEESFLINDISNLWTNISIEYRAAIHECIDQWLQNKSKEDNNDTNTNDDDEGLQLLQSIYAILHLSDIYLPLRKEYYQKNNNLLLDSSNDNNNDPYEIPGYATADTIRFLRYNYMVDPYEITNNNKDLPNVLDSLNPEQSDIYWKFLQDLVLRGCLDKAAEVLEIHSDYINAKTILLSEEEESDDNQETAQIIYNLFHLVTSVFRLAPLPGGRNDHYDHGFSLTDEEKAEAAAGTMDHNNDGLGDSTDVLDHWNLDSTDYMYWETSPILREDIDKDMPMYYSSQLAMKQYNTWKDMIHFVRTRTTPLLRSKYIQIDHLLQIMEGDVTDFNELHYVQFTSWADELCAKLLYVTPEITPQYISTMTEKYNITEDTNIPVIVNIMQRSPEEALDILFAYGGATGAALPSTLLALIFNLYDEMGILPLETENKLKLEVLEDAAFAIISSLHNDHNDIAVQLAIRLLKPYALYEGSIRIVTVMAEILDRYTPTTYQYGETLIEICRPLIERKSMQILDGCVSILIYLYHNPKRYMAEVEESISGLKFLLDGIELEKLVLPNPTLGSCYRIFCTECNKYSLQFLHAVIDKTPIDGSIFEKVQHMTILIQDKHVTTIPEATVLVKVNNLLHYYENYNNDMTRQVAADDIVACLQLKLIQFRSLLLQVAEALIAEDSMTPLDFPFTKRGVQTLLECLREEDFHNNNGCKKLEVLQECLNNAMTEAIYRESTERCEWFSSVRQQPYIYNNLRSEDVMKHNKGLQEMVTTMLDSY